MKQQKWTEGKDNSNIYQFKQEDRRKGLQEILKSSASRNLNYFISKYFHVILVNAFDKVERQCYFHFLPHFEFNLPIAPWMNESINLSIFPSQSGL